MGSGSFGCFFLGDACRLQDAMILAHHRSRTAIKSGPGDFPVGVNVSLQDEQALGEFGDVRPVAARPRRAERNFAVAW